MKIAVIGKGVTRDLAPKEGWARWGLAHDRRAIDCDRIFEIHSPDSYNSWNGHRHHLSSLGARLTVNHPNPEFPEAGAYPIDEIKEIHDEFSCSISYMVALAAMQKPTYLGLWGCDYDSVKERNKQLPNIQFWLGVARGYGAELVFPDVGPWAEKVRYGSEVH